MTNSHGCYQSDFNPRPRKEGDSSSDTAIFLISLFQSTPSQRGRHFRESINRMGVIISIHALAKRATSQLMCIFAVILFQSTPSQRGRHNTTGNRKTNTYFNPRPRKEGDFVLLYTALQHLLFQSTPSQRGRQQIYTMIIYILKLNITFRTFFLYKIIKN